MAILRCFLIITAISGFSWLFTSWKLLWFRAPVLLLRFFKIRDVLLKFSRKLITLWCLIVSLQAIFVAYWAHCWQFWRWCLWALHLRLQLVVWWTRLARWRIRTLRLLRTFPGLFEIRTFSTISRYLHDNLPCAHFIKCPPLRPTSIWGIYILTIFLLPIISCDIIQRMEL